MPSNTVLLTRPPNVTEYVISDTNRGGKLINSDLELAGLVLLWLMIKHVCTTLREKKVALFSNNSPTVSWVQRMACRSSLIAEQLKHILTLHINAQWSCPLTTLHIVGDQNSMTDIPSRSFGSEQKWHFKTDADQLTFFNNNFPLPNQNSWTVSQPTSAIATRLISILWITHFMLDEWRWLPAVATIFGPLASLYEAFGSGPISSGHNLLNTHAGPFRIHGKGLHGINFGQGKQVKHCTVSNAITAIGQMIALACDNNPTKIIGSDKLIPWL